MSKPISPGDLLQTSPLKAKEKVTLEQNIKAHFSRIQVRLRFLFRQLVMLLPQSLRHDPQVRSYLTRLLIVGLLLRLLLMPFAMHTDFLSEHWRAEMVAFGGVTYPTRIELLGHYLDALVLRIIRPLIPHHAYYFWPPQEALQGGFPSTDIAGYNRLASYPRVNRVLFLTKLPYLLFDVISAFLLMHLYHDAKKSARAFKFWMLNPALIFTVYVWGRYEVYALALVLLSMLFLRRGRWIEGALTLGVSVLFRASVLLIIPAYVMAIPKQWSRRALAGAAALFPYVGLFFFMENVLGLSQAFVAGNNPLFFSMLLNPYGELQVFPFLMGYVVIMLALDSSLWKSSNFRRYAVAALVIYSLMFTFSSHGPAYYVWIMPFLVWITGEDPHFGRLLLWQTMSWLSYWFVLIIFTPSLFSPLWIELQTLPLNRWFLDKLVNFGITESQAAISARSALAAVSAWIVVSAVRLETRLIREAERGESLTRT